ncbi:CRISPR-associated protein Cas2-1 [Methanobrevibacter ruminantium M1]|uniref:CRISPR-associated endoribonuclease Cas2 n=1 Tax=Methanobrevibacter ruminantium (strain ATCC 35063 / DSM 1093 / JCM 13430 / OCM 146 / M1) TaxID=634498 RepID=D3E289_METRM|nr:CRISPR-associated protein Cas2-1 [Methanobrevibacter ruminantium M1]
MYVIIVYDIKVERVNKVKSFLRQHLFWIQNSVFEGELTNSEYKAVTDGLLNIIEEDEDSVIIYQLMMEESLTRNVLGVEKASVDDVIL